MASDTNMTTIKKIISGLDRYVLTSSFKLILYYAFLRITDSFAASVMDDSTLAAESSFEDKTNS